jgi:hypothetical protein
MIALTPKQQKWSRIVTDWSESGLTQADYCRKYRIDLKRFYLWKSKLKSLNEQTNVQGEFIPLEHQLVPLTSNGIVMRIGRVEIHYQQDTDKALLLHLIGLLGETA